MNSNCRKGTGPSYSFRKHINCLEIATNSAQTLVFELENNGLCHKILSNITGLIVSIPLLACTTKKSMFQCSERVYFFCPGDKCNGEKKTVKCPKQDKVTVLK